MTEPGRYSSIAFEKGVATITWSRPDRRNAIGKAVCEELTGLLAVASQRNDCAVVVLRAAAAPFCAGWDVGDIEAIRNPTPEAAAEFFRPGRAFLAALGNLSQVTIAVPQGKTLGFGCSLLARCDLVVAADDAEFGLPEIRRGMPPATVLPELLAVVSPRAALAHAVTGCNFSAAEARSDGLVTHVVPAASQESFVLNLATQMAAYGGSLLAETKALVRRLATTPESERVHAGVQAAMERMLRGNSNQ